MIAYRREVEPEVCSYVDAQQNILIIEVLLPGVTKEDIRLKVNQSRMVLAASGDNVDFAKYIPFSNPVNAENVKAVFEHGLLRIKLPLRA